MPSPLPTRNTDSVIGPRKDRLGGPGPRLYTINSEDWNRAIDHLFAIYEELGELDGSTSGSVWEAISALGGGDIAVHTYAEQGSAPSAVANKVKVYAKDDGGTSALYARTDDGTEHKLTGASGGGWSIVTATGGGPATTLPDSNAIVQCTTSAGALVLNLPAASAGRMYVVRKLVDTGNHKITLHPPSGSVEIEGVAGDYDIPESARYVAEGEGQPLVWTVYSDGTSWWIGAMGSPRHALVSTDPTASDNQALGFDVGSMWVNNSLTPGGKLWALAGIDAGDANWVRIDGCVTLHFDASGSLPTYADATVTVDESGGAVTLTLPSNGTANRGRQYLVQKTSAGSNGITLARSGSELINGVSASYALPGSTDESIGRWHVFCDVDGNWWADT